MTEKNKVIWYRIADKFPGLGTKIIRAMPCATLDGSKDYMKTTDAILEAKNYDGTAFWMSNGENVDIDDVWTWDLENPPEFPSPIREDHMELADKLEQNT